MLDQLPTAVTAAFDRAKADLGKLDISKLDPSKLTTIDLTKLDLSKLDPRNIDLPKFDLPKVDLPQVDLPTLPDIDVPAGVERVADVARDAVYAGIGVAVVVAERVDAGVRRVARRSA